MVDYELFEHEADIGIRGFGETMAAAFENAAAAMFSIMVDIDKIDGRDEVEISCDAPDRETLLVEWLNALLAKADLEGMVFGRFKVEIDERENKLLGYAYGEPLDQKKHRAKTEVKAATYSNLRVGKNARWVAQCIVDV